MFNVQTLSLFFHAGVPEEGDGRGVWRGGCTKQPGSQSTPHKDVDALKDNQDEGWTAALVART